METTDHPGGGNGAWAEHSESWDAERTLSEMAGGLSGPVMLACSFQRETSVLIDMAARIDPSPTFFTLDTGLLFPETYAIWSELERRYSITVIPYRGISLDEQARAHGERLWQRDPARCCGLRKVKPLEDALSSADGWISGIRRSHSPTRAHTPKVHWDRRFGLWKANPLADWSDDDVDSYLHERGIPFNELHDRGYGSIGCEPCTRPGTGRDGRWPGSTRTECGIHGSPRDD